MYVNFHREGSEFISTNTGCIKNKRFLKEEEFMVYYLRKDLDLNYCLEWELNQKE